MKLAPPFFSEKIVQGIPLAWHRWQPEEEPLRGAFFFLHGQGDYGERYREVAEHFGKAGWAFATCDLPGHGRSPGKRGHLASFDIVREVARMGLAEAREICPHGLLGFGGHSVGGLLALALLGEMEAPDCSWISSPLLRPDAGQPAWKYTLLRPLSHLFPSATLSTGVSADLCRQYLPGESDRDHLLFHNRISMSWGRTLIDLAQVVREEPTRLPKHLPLLLTQGGRDQICPPAFCEDFVETLALEKLQFALYPEARHEPFADAQRAEIFATLQDWLATLSSEENPARSPTRSDRSRDT